MFGRFEFTCRTSKKTESIIYTAYHVHRLYQQELQKIQKKIKYGEFKSFKTLQYYANLYNHYYLIILQQLKQSL